MSTLDPNGKSHRVLRLLSQRPYSLAELKLAIAPAMPSGTRKAWYVVRALSDGGLIERTPRGHELTADGWEALQTLDAGEAVYIGHAAPTVRVFVDGKAA